MASPSVPLTPEPIDYAAVRTPRQNGAPSFPPVQPTPAWTEKYWFLGSLAQVIALGSAGVYFAAAVVYLTPYYFVLDPKLAIWWGAPSEAELEANPDASPGHPEMTLPTYLFLGLFVPFLLGSGAVHFLRNFNVRRITSRYLFQIAMVLRRKPVVFGKLSYFGYGELLFLVVFLLGGNVFVSWYQFDAYIGYIEDDGAELTLDVYLGQIGLLLGYTCVWNMAFLFLPATRNCAWMEFLGISYANGIKYHRWTGVMVLVTGVGHTIPYYWLWVREGTWLDEALPCFDCAVGKKGVGRHVWFNVFGELALTCFLVLAFASLPFVRRRLFEAFYYVHHLFIPGVIFTVLHFPTTTWFIFPSFLLYLIDRAVSSSNAFWPVQVAEFTALPDGIVKVVIARSPHDDGSYHIGQFVYLNAPTVSKLQWHPFTVASSPSASASSLTVLLKSLGDWTAGVAEYARECEAKSALPTLYMDGYYGESLNKYQEYPTVCLVGGGIGVTPILPILGDLATKALRNGGELTQRVFFVFTFREPSLLEELHPVLSVLRELDPQEQRFSYRLHLTRLQTEDALDRPIRPVARTHDKFLGEPHRKSHAVGASTPFAAPLRTPGVKFAVYGLIIVVAVFLVAYLEYGNGKIVDGGKKSQLWMVQDFVEISVLLVCSFLVYAAILIERFMKQRRSIVSGRDNTEKAEEISDAAFASIAHGIPDLVALRDLLAAHHVTLGSRPDMTELIREALVGHADFETQSGLRSHTSQAVGVFVSGPEALKSATEYAVASAGAHHFDIHAEEFEL